MSINDEIYVREILKLTGAGDLYEAAGTSSRASPNEIIDALEAKRAWARQYPDDPEARWWSRHLARATRLLIHSRTVPKRKRIDDLDNAIRGALSQGVLTEQTIGLLVRMGTRRGLEEADVLARIAAERKQHGSDGHKILCQAIWGATLNGRLSEEARERLRARGEELGVPTDQVEALLAEAMKAMPEVEERAPEPAAESPIEESPTDGHDRIPPRPGGWVPPHLRGDDWEPLELIDDGTSAAEEPTDAHADESSGRARVDDPVWTLDDQLEKGLEDIVRKVLEDGNKAADGASTQSLPNERPYLSDSQRRRTHTPVAAPAMGRARPVGMHPLELPIPAETWTRARIAHQLAVHTMYSTLSVLGGALYGVVVFLLSHRDQLF